MSTGENIRAARMRAGMTQAQLAEKLGVTPQNVSLYERDIKKPKVETLQKIAAALGAAVSDLDPSISTFSVFFEKLGKEENEEIAKIFLDDSIARGIAAAYLSLDPETRAIVSSLGKEPVKRRRFKIKHKGSESGHPENRTKNDTEKEP